MKILKTRREVNNTLRNKLPNNASLGFVPTMGALHSGHLTLIKRAIDENDLSICSIFVNPTQFNNKQDLEKYPRTIEKDIELLESINCDYLFLPTVEEMYPQGEENIQFDFGNLEKVMEGKDRPGHFQGVGIIVKKLFEIIQPSRAYFGKKDYQQLLIIKSLTKQYQLSPQIVACDIIRESDGLAISSRNQRLTIEQRKQAPAIYKALQEAQKLSTIMEIEDLKNLVATKINSNPTMTLGYFQISNKENLQPINHWLSKGQQMGFIVVNMGDVRLIDNIEL